MSTVKSLANDIEELLGDINYDPKEFDIYPFFVRVGVVKYRPPRHSYFEWIREMGATLLDPLIYHKKIDMPESLTFVFPERHLSVHEQQHFMYRIVNHPQVDKIKSIDIITSSPLVVSDFMSDMIRILTWPADEEEKLIIPFDK